jgi:hypothetical protein
MDPASSADEAGRRGIKILWVQDQGARHSGLHDAREAIRNPW